MSKDRQTIKVPKLAVPATPALGSPGLILPAREVTHGWRPKLWDNPTKVIPPCKVCGNTEVKHFCVPDALLGLQFFLNLRLTDGEFRGQPLVPISWVADLVPWIFGMKMYDHSHKFRGHYRFIQELVLSITRGGMKSTFLEAMICYFLWAAPDGSEGLMAQQSKKETIAKMVPKIIDMVELSPILNPERYHWVGETDRPGGGDKFYRGKARTKGELSTRVLAYRHPRELKGYRGNFAVFDEYGMVPSDQSEIAVEETFKKSVIAPEWLCIVASTLARDSAHYQRRETTRAMEALKCPEMAPRLWSALFVSDATDDIYSPTTWYKTIPLLAEGIISESSIAEEADAAKLDVSKEDTFAIERCGQAGEMSARLVRREEWMACKAKGGMTEILERMKGKPLFVAFDFSETSDLAAMGVVCEENEDTVLCYARHFIPSKAANMLNARTQGKVRSWIADGWLESLPSGQEMPRLMAERCLELLKPREKDVIAFGYDVALATEAAAIVREYGKMNKLWDGPKAVLGLKQGVGLAQPIKAMQIASRFKKIVHPGDPVLDFCVLNSYIEPSNEDPDKFKLVKIVRAAATERIDGAVAILNAWQRMIAWKAERSLDPVTHGASPYVTRARRRKEEEEAANE